MGNFAIKRGEIVWRIGKICLNEGKCFNLIEIKWEILRKILKILLTSFSTCKITTLSLLSVFNPHMTSLLNTHNRKNQEKSLDAIFQFLITRCSSTSNRSYFPLCWKCSKVFRFVFILFSPFWLQSYLKYLFYSFFLLGRKTEKTNVEPEKGFRSFRSSCFMHEPILKYDHEFGKRFVLFSCFPRYLVSVQKFLSQIFSPVEKEVWVEKFLTRKNLLFSGLCVFLWKIRKVTGCSMPGKSFLKNSCPFELTRRKVPKFTFAFWKGFELYL